MNNWLKITFLSFTLLFAACGTKSVLVQDKLNKVEASQLVAALDSINQDSIHFFSAKIDTKFSDNQRNVSFKTSLKIQKDSLVHALISYASVPVITALLSDDLFTMTNKQEKCYVRQGYSFFNQQFKMNVTFEDLQTILLGKVPRFNKNSTYYLFDDPYNYTLSNQQTSGDEGEVFIRYHLTRDLKQLKVVEMTDFSTSTTMSITYLDQMKSVDHTVPKSTLIQVKTARNEIQIHLNYDKVEVNNPKEMVIVIPDSYEVCK